MALLSPALAGGKPRQIIPCDRLEPAFPFHRSNAGHQMTRKTFDDRVGVDHLETFAQHRNARCGLHLFDMGHVGGAQDDAEYQPRRHLILGAIRGPAEPGAAQ